MPLNRKARLGLAAIVFALFLGIVYLFSRSGPTTQQTGTPSGLTPQPSTIGASFAPGTLIAAARENIPARALLTDDMFEMRAPKAGESGLSFITNPATQARGFITRVGIPQGAPLHPEDLLGHISDVGIAAALSPGTRAIVVPIANKPTLHDLVRIGDMVDIIADFSQAQGRTIVQNVRVLAVDVFGKDFPQTSVAMRGTYKADDHGVRTAVPASPNAGTAPGGAPGNGPDGGGADRQAAPQGAAATPTPTVTPTPPPGSRPDPAITLEVTPIQATAISLAESAGATLDIVLRPHGEMIVPGEAAPTDVILPQLAPYAARLKNGNGGGGSAATRTVSTSSTSTRSNGSGTSSRRRNGGYVDTGEPLPTWPRPDTTTGVLPPPTGITEIGPMHVEAPRTYDIPVFADGKQAHIDTVRKPKD